jgi:hypothetical protein
MPSEKIIQSAVRRLFSNHRVVSEVPFGEKKIDLVFVSPNIIKFPPAPPEEIDVVSVELKWKDWRRALKQASVNQLCSDRAYVAMPEANFPKDLSPFLKFGVGLIAVNGSARVMVESSFRKYTDPRFKKDLIDVIVKKLDRQKMVLYR